jgi:ADP-ribosylglycohydrolase
MLLGLAVGDALGNTSEGHTRGSRLARFGEIRDYQPNGYAGGRRVGLPSDDTQLAFWALEQILDDDGIFVPDNVARRYTESQIFGIGSTVRGFLRNYRDLGHAWYESGPESAGNGALMRIPAAVVPHAGAATELLWSDAALNTLTTHNDSAAIASSLGFVRLLWDCLCAARPPAADYWLEAFLAAAEPVETEARYSMRGGHYAGFTGKLTSFVEMAIGDALRLGLSTGDACDRWYSGAYLPETVPSALYILIKHSNDPEEAIVRAVNDTKDNDTAAAIVGAVVGAIHGADGLPERWRANLLGRTADDDDGKVFEIIERIRGRWFANS